MARAPSFSRVPDSDAAPYPLERRRFYILAVNSMLALMQCLNWFTFSSVDVARVRGYYGAHVIGGNARPATSDAEPVQIPTPPEEMSCASSSQRIRLPMIIGR